MSYTTVMDSQQAKKRIDALTAEINEHNHRYYTLSQPIIEDHQFDLLLKELQDLEAQFPLLASPDSPTQRVGGSVAVEFKTVRHRYPMLSLSNSYNRQDIEDFDNRIRKWLRQEGEPDTGLAYVCELKYDGVAIGLHYVDGALVQAVTRGDGQEGDDVTANVKTVRSIPLKLHGTGYPADFEIRGEIFLSRKTFIQLNRDKEASGEDLYANARNTASGTLKMHDPSAVAARNLDCYLYALYGEGLPYNEHYANMQAARSWGFKISEHMAKAESIGEIVEFINKWEGERHHIDVEIDGIVLKVNSYRMQERMGFTAKSPRWAMAYKYKAEQAATVLHSIDYQVGRTGAVTPVANLDPVLLSGTTVKRASLHNADQIARLDVRVGDTVFVEKGGEIIPKITGVEMDMRTENCRPVHFIKQCPECGTALVKVEGEAAHYCPNETGCPPQLKGKIEHFISRKAMNIDGLGEETVEQLFNAGLISTVADLYTLQYKDLIGLDRFAGKSARRLLDGLEASKAVPFDKVLFALGIRHVGETVAGKLARHFNSLDALIRASAGELTDVEEIGDKIAESLGAYFRNDLNLSVIGKLKDTGLQFEMKHGGDATLSRKLEGLSMVVSGVFTGFTREGIKEVISMNGGKVVSAISGSTSYVVAGDNMGPAKLAKAEKLGVPILYEQDFVRMIQ